MSTYVAESTVLLALKIATPTIQSDKTVFALSAKVPAFAQDA